MKKKPTSLRRSMFMRLGFNFYDVAVTIFCVAFGLLCFYPLWYCWSHRSCRMRNTSRAV